MRVNGHENSLHPELVDRLEEFLRLGSVPVDVELHEEGLVGAGLAPDDLGQRGRRVGRYLQYEG
jgi:preprotein translocase subunit SecD